VDLFGTDTGSAIELTYHLRALEGLREIFMKTVVVYDGEAPSVWRVFPAALYPEREAAELLGVSFAAHPNPKRLLTTDEVSEPLLRKSVAIRTPGEVAIP
jgi:NADH-quinone oxidoreductase subunit C